MYLLIIIIVEALVRTMSDSSDLETSGPSTPKKKRSIRNELAKDEKKGRKQLFCKKWMEDDIFKHWLQPTEDPYKSKCKACQLTLNTKKSDLLNHRKSKRHLKNIKALQGTIPLRTCFSLLKKTETVS